MSIGCYISVALAAIIVLFIAGVLIRTARVKPRAIAAVSSESVDFDRDGALASLQKLVRFKTISYRDSALEDSFQFDDLLSSLPVLFLKVLPC